jgi:glycosyltransferase involved in cell wall biosynthesis
MNDPEKILSIAIPTWNRAAKLKRLLAVIQGEIVTSCLQEQIEVLVSDNASSDNTSSIASEFKDSNFSLKYYRQPENLGFDNNVNFLYEQAKSKYIWYMSDDDLPLSGAISLILKSLLENNPDVLLFSFIQPPGSKIKTFNFPSDIEIIESIPDIIQLICKYPKISIFVLRKIQLSPSQIRDLEPFRNNEFYFLNLTYSVLDFSMKPKLCVISKQLATCDEDYNKFNYDDQNIFIDYYKVFQCPFVLKHLPNLSKQKIDESYFLAIDFLYAIKKGALIVDDIKKYDNFIETIPIRILTLLKKPKLFIALLLMKINMLK